MPSRCGCFVRSVDAGGAPERLSDVLANFKAPRRSDPASPAPPVSAWDGFLGRPRFVEAPRPPGPPDAPAKLRSRDVLPRRERTSDPFLATRFKRTTPDSSHAARIKSRNGPRIRPRSQVRLANTGAPGSSAEACALLDEYALCDLSENPPVFGWEAPDALGRTARDRRNARRVLPAERTSCPSVLAFVWPSRWTALAVQRCKI